MRLELAADYLVMAAWLAYLKSRLLLPEPPKAEAEDAAELADALARRLRRLEQIRLAAEMLINRPAHRPRLLRARRARGDRVGGDEAHISRRRSTTCSPPMRARRQKHARAHVRMKPRDVWSLAEAREALTRLLGVAVDWIDLDHWLIAYCVDPKMRRTARASSFSASLELVREGKIELRQEAPSRRSSARRAASARAAPTQAA